MTRFVRPLLLLAGACALSGCVCWHEHVHLYATDLDARDGPYVLAWPADGNGSRFRYLVEREEGELSDLPVETAAVDAVEPPRDVAAAIVVLPEDPEPALRERANAFLAAVTASSPGAGVHVVTDAEGWDGFRRTESVIRRMHRLRAESAKRRPFPGSWLSGLARLLVAPLMGIALPDAIVVPQAGTRDRFLLATELTHLRFEATTVDDVTVTRLDRHGVLTVLAVRRPRWELPLPDGVQVAEGQREQGAAEALRYQPVVLLLRPEGMPPEHAAEFDALLAEIAATPGLTAVSRWSEIPYEALVDAAALREALDAAAIPFARTNLLRSPGTPRE